MITQVRPMDLSAWFKAAPAGTQPVVLDVREPGELRTASIQPDGFTLVTIPMGSIPARLSELDPEQPIACLCHHGARSMQVASFLQSRGFDRLANIAGGIQAWSDERDPSVPRY